MQKRRLDRLSIGILLSVVAAAAAAACSPDSTSDGDGSSFNRDDDGATSGKGGSSGTDSGSGGTDAITVAVGTGNGNGGGGNEDPDGDLSIDPSSPSLDVEYGTPGQTVQFTAKRDGQTVDGVVWFLSSPEAGTISESGLFTSNGNAGGVITVGAKLPDVNATTQLTINLHVVDNVGAIQPSDIDVLESPNPGQTDAAWATWYPYNKTVFPRGVPAPTWQFGTNSSQGSAYQLKITGTNLSYEGYCTGAGQQLRPSQAAWDAMGSATDGTDMTVEVSKLVGGVKYGPMTSSVRVARGTLKGTIYYNTYDSQLAGGTGAIMRIRGNSTTPEVLLGGCVVCHSVAADGSTVAAAEHGGNGGIFDLVANPDAPPRVWADAEAASFAGLYPIGGQVLVTNGNPGQSYPPNTPGSSGVALSTLRMRDGTIIADSGIEPYYAQTPVFSNDGSKLAFYDRPAGGSTGVLAIMDFDFATKKFTNYQILDSPQGGRHLSWPAFTPDNQYVIFQDGQGDDLVTWGSNTAVLRAISTSTGEIKTLANLNAEGFAPPQGARDQNLNFEPTVLPIASGGYFWVMMTSRRTFGNTLVGDRSQTKRLWVSAFDFSGNNADPSHPAFYIEGQELASGNSRGFWALDPCRSDGEGCESGDQCCNGFCNPSEGDPNVFECGQPDPGNPDECSDEFESCETAGDCCDPTMLCINGRCAEDTPDIPN